MLNQLLEENIAFFSVLLSIKIYSFCNPTAEQTGMLFIGDAITQVSKHLLFSADICFILAFISVTNVTLQIIFSLLYLFLG